MDYGSPPAWYRTSRLCWNSMIMRTLIYKWFIKFFEKELKEEFDAYDGGGYLNAQMDIAKKLLSRGMDMAEVADVVGMDEDDIEENFGNG